MLPHFYPMDTIEILTHPKNIHSFQIAYSLLHSSRNMITKIIRVFSKVKQIQTAAAKQNKTR